MIEVVDCKMCGEPVVGKRKDAVFCSTKCGSKSRNKKYQTESKEKYLTTRKRANKKFRSTPYGRYSDHKHRAKQSGVDFLLTYEEWWSLWEPHWGERGLGGLVMCRNGDTGAYELGNVRIDTQANNNREAHGCLLK